MYLIYYDEVKYAPPTQEAQLFGGIAIRAEHALELEQAVNELSAEYFGNSLLDPDTEFHAKEIFQGKKNWKGRDPAERLEVASKLLDIIADERVCRIYASLRYAKVPFPCEPQDTAFMLFVEKTDEFLRQRGDIGMLFGDHDLPMISPSVTNLSHYRQNQTLWRRGKKITNLVDTVHFAHSHHSRLIQLADMYVYATQYQAPEDASFWRKEFKKMIREKDLFPTKYRVYPMY